MRSLCLCPVSPEYQALVGGLEALGLKREIPDPLEAQLSYFPEIDLYVGKAGIGSNRFGKNATWSLQKLRPQLLYCAGGAVALAAQIPVGQIVVNCLDPQLRSRLSETTNDIFIGANLIATVDSPITDPITADALHTETSCLAAAMEGQGGLDAAALAGLPFVELRTVTDTPFDPNTNPAESLEQRFSTAIGPGMAGLARIFVLFQKVLLA